MAGDPDFDVVVHPLDGHTFWGEVVGLSGCVTQGESYTEVLERLEDAFAACTNGSPLATFPHPSEESFEKVTTSGELAAYLQSLGWTVAHASDHHDVYHAPDGGARLTVIREPGIELYSPVREAARKVLGL